MSRITPATEFEKKSSTYLIYGGQGMGKSTSLKYIPGKTLVLDVDKSFSVLAGEKHIDRLEIDTSNTWDDWTAVVMDIVNGKIDVSKYDNIAVDNVSELFRSALEDLGKKGKATQDGVPGMADYQKIDFMLLRSLRGLNSLDKRIIFTAWEETDLWEHESGQSFNRKFPMIREKIRENFMGLCDVIANIVDKTEKDGSITKGFILQPTLEVTAKNRLDDRPGCLVKDLVIEGD